MYVPKFLQVNIHVVPSESSIKQDNNCILAVSQLGVLLLGVNQVLSYFIVCYLLEDVFVHHDLQSSVFNYAYGGKFYSFI